MVAPGPSSDINREYFAQNNERAIENGQAGIEEYSKTDEKARELLRKLATSKPYFKSGRTAAYESTSKGSSAHHGNSAVGAAVGGPGPVRTRDTKAAIASGALSSRKFAKFSSSLPPPGPNDWIPPADKNIMSLFVTGIEDDLPEFKIRDFFKAHGKIKSLVCSHMTHCAFVNYETREGAEAAASACQGKAVIAGCPLRVRWGVPKSVGVMDKEKRAEMLRDGRRMAPRPTNNSGNQASHPGNDSSKSARQTSHVAPPPGTEESHYAALKGE
ncbi:Pre-mRNA-splicing factor slt11 [Ceratocystis pirilliformis]|uniref:Pre-mRNA-splicing factor slt11 n=1 Tax=Ceratocystis pirilliformis TaxID=259994 RepID=A0ABR3YL23_9PEZI